MSTRSTAGKPCAPRGSGGFFLLFSGPVRKVSLLRGNLRLSLFTSRARFKSCRSARHADKCSWRRADGKLAKVVDGAGSASPRAPPRRIYKIALYSEKGQVRDLSLKTQRRNAVSQEISLPTFFFKESRLHGALTEALDHLVSEGDGRPALGQVLPVEPGALTQLVLLEGDRLVVGIQVAVEAGQQAAGEAPGLGRSSRAGSYRSGCSSLAGPLPP